MALFPGCSTKVRLCRKLQDSRQDIISRRERLWEVSGSLFEVGHGAVPPSGRCSRLRAGPRAPPRAGGAALQCHADPTAAAQRSPEPGTQLSKASSSFCPLGYGNSRWGGRLQALPSPVGGPALAPQERAPRIADGQWLVPERCCLGSFCQHTEIWYFHLSVCGYIVRLVNLLPRLGRYM